MSDLEFVQINFQFDSIFPIIRPNARDLQRSRFFHFPNDEIDFFTKC